MSAAFAGATAMMASTPAAAIGVAPMVIPRLRCKLGEPHQNCNDRLDQTANNLQELQKYH
jgi:hypothetical protein